MTQRMTSEPVSLMSSASRALVAACLFVLASCGPSYDSEVNGTLIVAMRLAGMMGQGERELILLIETAPETRTRFYVSAETQLVNIERVEGAINWEAGKRYIVRGNKTERKPIPGEGDRIVMYPGIVAYVDATYVEKVATTP
jgi:hypothetical protein